MVSVIIPVYNVERNLNKCVDSVVNSSFKDIEIILVNDGSKDNSLNICQEYAQRYSFIHVVDKPNDGLSSARNAGIDISLGDRIMFVDSDDWIDKDYIKVLNDTMDLYNVDLVRGKLISVNKDVEIKHTKLKIKILQNNSDVMKYALKYNYLYCSVLWLYSKRVIENIRFDPSVKLGEDQKYNYEVFIQSNTLACVNYIGYFYYTNPESLSSGKLKPNHKDDLRVRNYILDDVILKHKSLEKYARQHLALGYYGFYMRGITNGLEESVSGECLAEYKKQIIANTFHLWASNNMSVIKKMSIFVIMVSERLTKFLAQKLK